MFIMSSILLFRVCLPYVFFLWQLISSCRSKLSPMHSLSIVQDTAPMTFPRLSNCVLLLGPPPWAVSPDDERISRT